MKVFKIILFLCVSAVLVIPVANAQDPLPEYVQGMNYQAWKRYYAQQQFEILQSGALLVRLKTRSNSIEALKSRGQEKAAAEIFETQQKENKKIAEAFTANFDFAPVYFFYSDDSKYLLSDELDKVTFLNPDLTPVDSNVTVSAGHFLIAEFGTVAAEPEEYYLHYTKSYKGEVDSTGHVSTGDMGFSALVVYNNDLLQLTDPFPYYVRLYRGLLFFERSYDKAVSILDKRLKEL